MCQENRRKDYPFAGRSVGRLVFFSFIFSLSSCSFAFGQDSTDRLYESAKQAIETKDYARAVTLLKMLVDSDPKNVSYRLDLSIAQSGSGDVDAAVESLQKILEMDPKHEEAITRLAAIWIERKDWTKVIPLLQPLADQGRSYTACHELAVAYDQQNQLSSAAWYYERAVQINPKATDDLVRLGNLHLQQGLPALTIRALRSALELGVQSAEVHTQLAQAYLQIDVPLGKVQLVPLANAVVGKTCGAWYVLEAVGGQPNRYRACPDHSAIYHLEKAFEMGLDEPAMHVLQGDIWLAAKDYSRARDVYQSVESTVPAEVQAAFYYHYGQALFGLNDLTGFLKCLETAIQRDPQTYQPKRREAYTMLADRYCMLGDLDHTIEYLTLATQEAPTSAELHLRLGNAMYEAKRTPEAFRQWRMTLQLEPQHPDRERLLKLMDVSESPPTPEHDPTMDNTHDTSP